MTLRADWLLPGYRWAVQVWSERTWSEQVWPLSVKKGVLINEDDIITLSGRTKVCSHIRGVGLFVV